MPALERMALPSTLNSSLKDNNTIIIIREGIPGLGLHRRRCLGFKGFRVSSQSGFVGGTALRYAIRAGGLTSPRFKSRIVAAASQEESAPSDVEVEKVRNELEKQADESQEPWKQTVDSIKEQASRMQDISKEAYTIYAEKARAVLTDSTEQLKLQAEKTKVLLASTAEEMTVMGKENLSALIENAPEPVKDLAETALGVHPEELKKLSKIHDFCLGIPYGALLFVGGLLSFLITGSIPAVRFGVILGGIHLALSTSSLKAWKKGGSVVHYLKGQSAIALIILGRELRVLQQRPTLFPSAFMALISAAMLLFYGYVYLAGQNSSKKVEPESSN